MSKVLKQGVQLDIELSLPVHKLWDALLNMENVAPKIALTSHKGNSEVGSVRLLKGNGGVGSISLRVFADGRYENERLESVDARTHTLVSTVISPGSVEGIYNQYTKTMSLSTARNGNTTIARWRAECAPAAEGASPVIRGASDYALVFFKALESYLSAAQDNSA